MKKKLKKYGLSYGDGEALKDLRRRLAVKIKEMRRNKGVDKGDSDDKPDQRGHRQGSIESLTSSSSNASKIQDSNGNLVFSKFDFIKPPTILTTKEEDEIRRKSKPKVQRLKDELRKATWEQKKIERIAEINPEKGAKLKANKSWQHAFEKVEGQKIKDDPAMINKAIKKIQRVKKQRAIKWAERNRHVKEQMAERQKKRTANINKRKQAKKEAKIKKAKKKGRLIPGF